MKKRKTEKIHVKGIQQPVEEAYHAPQQTRQQTQPTPSYSTYTHHDRQREKEEKGENKGDVGDDKTKQKPMRKGSSSAQYAAERKKRHQEITRLSRISNVVIISCERKKEIKPPTTPA